MKKRYYLSMLSIYLLSFTIDCIYLTSHKSLSMFFSMIIPNFVSFGLINLLGAFFIYKPIDKLFAGKINPSKVKKRIDNLAWHSSVWIFFVGVLSGFVLLVSVFFFKWLPKLQIWTICPVFFLSL